MLVLVIYPRLRPRIARWICGHGCLQLACSCRAKCCPPRLNRMVARASGSAAGCSPTQHALGAAHSVARLPSPSRPHRRQRPPHCLHARAVVSLRQPGCRVPVIASAAVASSWAHLLFTSAAWLPGHPRSSPRHDGSCPHTRPIARVLLRARAQFDDRCLLRRLANPLEQVYQHPELLPAHARPPSPPDRQHARDRALRVWNPTASACVSNVLRAPPAVHSRTPRHRVPATCAAPAWPPRTAPAGASILRRCTPSRTASAVAASARCTKGTVRPVPRPPESLLSDFSVGSTSAPGKAWPSRS